MIQRLCAALFIALVISLLTTSAAAQSAGVPSTPEQRKARLLELSKQRDDLIKQIEGLNFQKTFIEAERSRLLREVVKDEEEESFKASAPTIIHSVVGEQTVIMLYKGKERRSMLAGMSVKALFSEQSNRFLSERLSSGLAYIRCVDEYCENVYVYTDKNGLSLNAELVKMGYAYILPRAAYDVAKLSEAVSNSIEPSKSESSTQTMVSPSSSGSTSTPGKDVQVKGYYRKDGTYVRPHTRSAPGTKKKP